MSSGSACNPEPKEWKVTEPIRKTVLAIHYLADYDPEPAVRYLQARSRQHQWRPRMSDEEVASMVENLFISSDEGEGAALADSASPADAGVHRKALKVVEEWKVVKWGRQCNTEASVAPSSASMLDRLEENRMKIPVASRPQTAGNVSMSSARSRMHRIRSRWGGRFRATPAGERVEPAEAMAKVRLSIQTDRPWAPCSRTRSSLCHRRPLIGSRHALCCPRVQGGYSPGGAAFFTRGAGAGKSCRRD